jgi:hypothetical protein
MLSVLLLAMAALPLVLFAQYGGGQYTIVNAQYGTAAHHVDVTSRLRQLAQQNGLIHVGNDIFGGDPDPGHTKVLRVYAREGDGDARMFEFPEGSNIDGAQFANWRGGNWGNGQWNGRWDGDDYRRGGHYVNQPEMQAALDNLRQAQQHLQNAAQDKGGHRVRALQEVQEAIQEVEAGVQYDNTH